MSAINRNYKGRSGPGRLWLASPLTVAASARRLATAGTAYWNGPMGLFEIDEFSEDLATSVVLRGRARHLEGREADATDQLPLRPWVDTAKFNVIAIDVDDETADAADAAEPDDE